MSDPKSDPFDSLVGIASRVDPDHEFVASVMNAVQERLEPPSVTRASHARTDLPDLEVVPMDTQSTESGHGHRWWMAAAASIAVVGVGLLALTTFRDEPGNPATGAPAASVAPATTAPPRDMGELIQDDGFPPVEAGAYVIDPDGDASTPLTVAYDVPAGWSAWPGAVKFYDPNGQVLLTITTVTNVVTDGCADHSPADPAVGSTVDDLATALAELAPFEVSSPPTDVSVFGYQGKYVQLTVPDTPVAGEDFTDCDDGKIRSWIDPFSGVSFYGYNAEPGRIEEFWILDVDGTRLVIETNWSPASPEADVAEMRAIFDSIRIEP